MKVESLFVDEDLGPLAPTALNIAMDALVPFHNQGSKAGIVSQVQEMAEKIALQINLSKQQSGKSKVEAIGIYLLLRNKINVCC